MKAFFKILGLLIVLTSIISCTKNRIINSSKTNYIPNQNFLESRSNNDLTQTIYSRKNLYEESEFRNPDINNDSPQKEDEFIVNKRVNSNLLIKKSLNNKILTNTNFNSKNEINAAVFVKKEKKNAEGGGKSQFVAFLLAFFLGGIGIHRFYLGYVGAGIIQLLTFGGCGIWALIDLIRIIVGDLKPKNGSYGK